MSTRQLSIRVLVIGLVLGAIDAIAGRAMRAQPDPSIILSLGATAWIAYRLARAGQRRQALYAAISLWIVYMAAFVLCARLLVGWNGSVPWEPRSGTWLVLFAAAVPVVAVIAQMAGLRAGLPRGDKAIDGSANRT